MIDTSLLDEVASHRTAWAAALAAAALSVVVADTLKHDIGRPRPPAVLALVHAAGPSRPSTDVGLTASVAAALVSRLRGGALVIGVVVGGTAAAAFRRLRSI